MSTFSSAVLLKAWAEFYLDDLQRLKAIQDDVWPWFTLIFRDKSRLKVSQDRNGNTTMEVVDHQWTS